MDLRNFIEDTGHGAVAALVRKSGLSRNTIEKAQRGDPIGAKAAKALSAATGGKVSARSLVGV